MATIDQAIELLTQANELDMFEGEVTDAAIRELTAKTKCHLSPDYQAFLARCGFASWDGHSVFGVYNPKDPRFPPSYHYSASVHTAEARAMHQAHPYPHMSDSVVIGKDGMGGYFLLLCQRAKLGGAVVWVNFDEDWVVTRQWESFADHLYSQLSAT